MKTKNIVLGIIDLVVWYFFVYYIVYVLQNLSSINAWWAAFIILVLGAVGTVLCPWFENTDGWKRMLRKEDNHQ